MMNEKGVLQMTKLRTRLVKASEQPDTLEKVEVSTAQQSLHQIILYNDDVNTFDWVIESLVDICEHSLEQAEQCSILVHYKGKCEVKTGTYKELEPRCTALLERGLSAEIN
jgi:ATP-dependent Clp protease adaptor protein ClpS